MINLLPPPAFKSTLREYRLRVLTVWLFLFSAALIIGTVALLPPYLLVGAQINALEMSVNASANRVAEFNEAEKSLKQAAERADILRATSEEKFMDYATLITEETSGGITINSLTFSRIGTTSIMINISGAAANRETLAGFRDQLESNPAFARVDLPVSSLIKDADIPFSLQITTASTTKP